MKKDPHAVEYFRDGNRWVASIGRGELGFFIHQTGGEGWSFIVPESVRWNSLHQDLYFAHHDFEPCHGGEESSLPALPPIPKFESVSWKNNFLPEAALSTEAYPMVTVRLHASPERQIRVWILLLEDKYETLLGDGCFRYFFEKQIFLSESDAHTAAAAGDGEGWHELSVTSIVIGLEKTAIVPVLFEPGVFDHYNFQDVVSALDGWIPSAAADQS